MKRVWRISLVLMAAAGVMAGAGGSAGAATSAAHYGRVTCSGGTVKPGTYKSLRVVGACTLTSTGTVRVKGDVTVARHGLFDAITLGTLKVGGDVIVANDGTAGIGCSPAIGCTATTSDTIGGDLTAGGAWATIVHSTAIGGNLTIRGGGRTENCAVMAPFGAPWYSDLEDNIVGGHVTVLGVHSCWFGFIRNQVTHNVTISGTRMGDPDANEITTNVIGGNLACFNNVPQPQFGDSSGTPNTVAGKKLGECKAL